MASVYDPLGFLGPLVLRAKNILQEDCQKGISWDDPLSEELRPKVGAIEDRSSISVFKRAESTKMFCAKFARQGNIPLSFGNNITRRQSTCIFFKYSSFNSASVPKLIVFNTAI